MTDKISSGKRIRVKLTKADWQEIYYALVTKAIEDRVCVEVRRFQGHTGEVACVAFSPDGKRALSGAAKRQYSIHASREKKESGRMIVHDLSA